MIQSASQSSLQPVHPNYSQQPPPSRGILGTEAARQLIERPVYCREGSSPRRTPTYVSREQKPPQVVRGSPSQGFKDMLVPSIETSSDGSSERRNSSHVGFRHEPYSRRLPERRMASPLPRQVIVIDDSPDVKRRRVVHEDVSHIVRQPEIPPSRSIHSRPFISQSRERVPVFDAVPSEDVFFSRNSRGNSCRYEREEPRVRNLEPTRFVPLPASHMDKRGSPNPMRYANNPDVDFQGYKPPAGPEVFHHEHPESRTISSTARDRGEDLIPFPDNIHGDSVVRGHHPQSEERADRSFITLRQAQEPPHYPAKVPL